MYGVHSAQLLQVRMCDVETMSLVGYKIGYIVNCVSNPTVIWTLNGGVATVHHDLM